ncbi:MAG: hypothetical protein WAP03_22120 [Methylorubrum rhodinum]|uniref:hypothetical protein n=1 Tax=Methylorubrum rhodinum TaxID=29428 RepID=UPI003BB15FC4
MRYNQPFDATDPQGNAPYINGNPAASIRGSIPPAAAFETPQRELVAIIAEAGDQTPSNDDLRQVLRAIRGGRLTTFFATGSANTLAIAATTPHTTLFRGLPFRIFPSATNTQSAVTLSVNGTLEGLIVRTDGSALAAGDIEAGCPFDVVHDGSRFRLMGPGRNEFARFLETGTLYVSTLGSDSADGLTPATALRTVGEARIRSTRFYQRGMPLLIKLVRPGTYPLPASGPILSGAQIIQGDPDAQDAYILEGATGGSAPSVIGSGGIDLTLEGLTVLNPTTGRFTLSSSRGGNLLINKVTIKSASPLNVAHVYCSGFAGVEIGTGCLWDSSADAMVSVRKGEIAFTSNSQSSVRDGVAWSEAAAVAFDGGTIIVRGGSQMTGNATGRRYDSDTNAVINAGGAGYEFFRGNANGVTNRGGLYTP